MDNVPDCSMQTISLFASTLTSFRERLAKIERRITYFPDNPRKNAAIAKLRRSREKISSRLERAVLLAAKVGWDKTRIAGRFGMELAEVRRILTKGEL